MIDLNYLNKQIKILESKGEMIKCIYFNAMDIYFLKDICTHAFPCSLDTTVVRMGMSYTYNGCSCKVDYSLDSNIVLVECVSGYIKFFNLYDRERDAEAPAIKKVIYNPPATIVLWADDVKTVVKAQDEEFDAEKGLAMAIVKRVYGNKGSYNELFKKWGMEND